MNKSISILSFSLGIMLCLSSLFSKAQCVFSVHEPVSVSQVTIDDLFQISVSCNSNASFRFVISIYDHNNVYLADVISSDYILSNSNFIVFSQANISLLYPLRVVVHTKNNISDIISSLRIIPEGQYKLKYVMLVQDNEQIFVPQFEYDYILNVELSIPPVLLSPMCTKGTLFGNPLFSWSPAFSSVSNLPYTYNIHFFEIFSNQDRFSAAQYNKPFVSVTGIQGNSHFLSSYDENLFLDGKCYAWYVEVVSGSFSVGRSDVCEICKSPEKINMPEKAPYIDIQKSDLSQTYTAIDGNIYFSYKESYFVEDYEFLNLKLFSVDRKKYLDISFDDFKVRNGQNFYTFNTCGDRDLKPGQYILEIENQKGKIFRISFIKPINVECK